jgi:hypothetical protein
MASHRKRGRRRRRNPRSSVTTTTSTVTKYAKPTALDSLMPILGIALVGLVGYYVVAGGGTTSL